MLKDSHDYDFRWSTTNSLFFLVLHSFVEREAELYLNTIMIKGKSLSVSSGSASQHSSMTPGVSGSARPEEFLQGIPVHEIFPDKDIWEDVLT